MTTNQFQALHNFRPCDACTRLIAVGSHILPPKLCPGCKWNKNVIERLHGTIDTQETMRSGLAGILDWYAEARRLALFFDGGKLAREAIAQLKGDSH